MLSQSGNVTPKQANIYSNQVSTQQWLQSNVVATNQIQSGPQNFHTLQQNFHSNPLNKTTQQQTNLIAQQSAQSYNYQQTPQSINVQQNLVMSSNSLNLQNPSLQASDSQTPSSLSKSSTLNASKKHHYTGSNTNSF